MLAQAAQVHVSHASSAVAWHDELVFAVTFVTRQVPGALAVTREEDPVTSSQPFYVQGRERLRTRGERNQAAAMAEGGFAQTSQTDRGASERQDAAEQVSAAKIELKETREAPATSALTESRTAEPKVEDKNPAPEIAQSDEKRDERQVFPLCAMSVPCNHLCNGL